MLRTEDLDSEMTEPTSRSVVDHGTYPTNGLLGSACDLLVIPNAASCLSVWGLGLKTRGRRRSISHVI
jgi:hypothetical protein